MSFVLFLGGMDSARCIQPSIPDNALRCSAFYLIASSIGSGNKQSMKNFLRIQKVFEGIYSIHEQYKNNKVVTTGMIYKNKSMLAIQLGERYDQNPKTIYLLEMKCNAWREIMVQHFAKKINNSSAHNVIRFAYLSVPDMPNAPPANHPRWTQSKKLVDLSFSTWTKNGRITPYAIHQQLKNQLKQSLQN